MARQGWGALRVAAIVGFVLTMPVLALPAVNDRLDRWIFGDEIAWDAEHAGSSVPSEANAAIATNGASETNGPSGSSDLASLGPTSSGSNELDDEARDLANSTALPNKLPNKLPNDLATGTRPGRPRLTLVETSTPLERLPLVASDAENPRGLAPNEALASDRMRTVHARLEQLGASYLRLEELESGRQERLFRFQCQLPIAGGSAYHRPFQVEHADPLEAMQRVLAEVETWCAARDAPRRAWR